MLMAESRFHRLLDAFNRAFAEMSLVVRAGPAADMRD
jgi:hypothetical protein